MAKTTITAWDVAQLLGLEYLGEDWCTYDFSFGGKKISVNIGCGDDDAVNEEEAKEEAGRMIMYRLGAMLASVHVNY